MQIKVIKYNLFDIKDPVYYFAHCISSDFRLGAGIAVEFNKRYGIKDKLEALYPDIAYRQEVGIALLTDNVFNLVTKECYYDKPTLKTMYSALVSMREHCDILHVEKLGIPMIGCGLDKLNWGEVKILIQQVFKDSDIKITVCYL